MKSKEKQTSYKRQRNKYINKNQRYGNSIERAGKQDNRSKKAGEFTTRSTTRERCGTAELAAGIQMRFDTVFPITFSGKYNRERKRLDA